MISREPINPNRIRRITDSFSWIDHRLLHDGFLAAMSPQEMLLYFFLLLVGDRNGISFYSYDKICAIVKLDLEQFIAARDQLIRKSLIAYDGQRFQVLQLPQAPSGFAQKPSPSPRPRPGGGRDGPQSLAEIFKQVT